MVQIDPAPLDDSSEEGSARSNGADQGPTSSFPVRESQALSVAEMFSAAREAAVLGNYDEKLRLYEAILVSPEAADLDRFRVNIYFADILRRKGDPQTARQKLGELVWPETNCPFEVVAEYWQALGQCDFMTGEVSESLAIETRIISDDAFESLPLDKQLYYLETGIAMKLELNCADAETRDWLNQYGSKLDSSGVLTEGVLSRARAMLCCLQGDYNLLSGGEAQFSLGLFTEYFDLSPAPRNKVDAAAKCLSLVYSGAAQSDRQREFEQYFVDNYQVMDPTDLAGIPTLQEISKKLIGD